MAYMFRLIYLAVFFAHSILNAELQASDPPSAISTSDFVTYQVTMQTKLQIPESQSPSIIKVWHAQPTLRPWSMTGKELGCHHLSNTPSSGELEHREDKNSRHVFWQFDNEIIPGGSIECESIFYVNSCDRNFYPNKSKTKWSDYQNKEVEGDLPSELVELANRLRRRNRPSKLVEKACGWLSERLIYDASVSHSGNDAEATLRAGRGHCGHYCNLLRLICNASGIPFRSVNGLNLHTEEATTGRLYKTRADYVNIHTWAEVYFPEEGWIEVEPSKSREAFNIPARFIQNNPWFQNYSVWVQENNRWKKPKWIRRQGGWDSEYKIENLIHFKTIAIGEGDPQILPRLWTTKNAKNQLLAALVKHDNEKAELVASDGRSIEVYLKQLCNQDNQVIESISGTP